MKVNVDSELCIGCGVCETTAPDVFQLGDEGIAIVLVDIVPVHLEPDIQTAIDDCPQGAISYDSNPSF